MHEMILDLDDVEESRTQLSKALDSGALEATEWANEWGNDLLSTLGAALTTIETKTYAHEVQSRAAFAACELMGHLAMQPAKATKVEMVSAIYGYMARTLALMFWSDAILNHHSQESRISYVNDSIANYLVSQSTKAGNAVSAETAEQMVRSARRRAARGRKPSAKNSPLRVMCDLLVSVDPPEPSGGNLQVEGVKEPETVDAPWTN